MSIRTARVAATNAGLTPGSTGWWAFIRLHMDANA